jgi:hypothetical protein
MPDEDSYWSLEVTQPMSAVLGSSPEEPGSATN